MSTLSVLQFNAWLLAFPWGAYSRNYRERLSLLPDALAGVDADVISLQEVWVGRDKGFLERELRKRGYAHFIFTRHRFGLGDGMFFASRYPVKRVERERPFRTVTRLIELFAAKRTVAATIEVPGAGDVDFYQTHLGSVLFDETRVFVGVAIAVPARAFVELIVEIQIAGQNRELRLAVAPDETGDLEELNEELLPRIGVVRMGLFVETLRAADLCFENSFLAANGMDVSHLAVPTYSQQNPYAREGFANNPEETLDYVLFTPDSGWRPRESCIVFRERISERVPALSDHYGIRTVFEFSSPEKR